MVYDCVIVGGGPAGLTAAIYLARANKKVVIIENTVFGGQVAEIGLIENYPGYESISGSELAMLMCSQAKKQGVEFVVGEAISFDFEGEVKKIATDKKEYEAKSIILATGSKARTLNIENEKKFIGSGVSYCATCDGNFFKGKVVAVVGSGDSAVSNAQYLSNLANKVYIISKYSPMKLKSYTMEDVEMLKNVELVLECKVTGIVGEGIVEGIKFEQEGEEKILNVDGIFVSTGRTPDTENLAGIIDLDPKGYILTNGELKTNKDGVFAAGDIVSGSLKQIVSAAGAGAIASTSALKYLNTKR